jgi:four helix bundle protein
MASQADELAQRVEIFAVRVLTFVRRLPRDPALDGILRQITRSAPGEAAHYRAARRGRSRREFVAKLGTVAEEADESEDSQILRSSDPQILRSSPPPRRSNPPEGGSHVGISDHL